MCVLECLSRLKISTRVKDIFLFKSCSFVNASDVLISSLSVSNRKSTSLIKGIYLFHTNGFVSLSFTDPEASLCCGEAGEKEKERARGTMGRGKREGRPHPIVPHALSIFSIIAIFL